MRHFTRTPPGSTLDARNWSRADVLVLNVTYEALCEIPAERAVVLLSVGVFRRDRHRCGYCDDPVATTIDHVVPRSRGGPNTWADLVACCAPCNQRKADRTPEEAGMPLLWEPRAPRPIEKAQRRIWRDLAAV
ncbi:HNH endonuclease [Rhodococcus sp. WS4]|nr:HNH endonuclease [Rhodococcus sp. WS4]